jgi:uncharacterized protein with von Willebrand factor type A (vWA) domain
LTEDLDRQPDVELPLLELFYRLREARLPLGIAEYELLPRALLAGFGFDGAESLKRLCRLLWIKSPEEEIVFNHVFAEFLNERPAARPKRVEMAEEPDVVVDDEKPAPPELSAERPDDQDRKPDPGPDGDQEKPALERPPIEIPERPDRQRDPKRRPDISLPQRDRTRKPASAPAMTRAASGIADETAAAVLASGILGDGPSRERRYRFKADYLPITKRQMKQSWRYLRKSVREGPPVEFDVEATVDKAAVEGRLYEPVMRPRRINRAAMVLMIDQEGSMAPFHAFSRRLEETAVRGGRLGQTNLYYFNNFPFNVLYCNPHFSESRPLETVIGEMHPTRTAVMIFSDAGAARDRYSYERVDMTRAFLRRLYQSVRYVAWLNPMPMDRWANTSAAAIAQTVPMFDVSRAGLQDAISVLRGRVITRR